VTFLTLLAVLTFDNWGDLFYTSYEGCDTYGWYSGVYSNFKEDDAHRLGDVMHCVSSSSVELKVTAVIYFFSFCLLAGFCILSMFVGAVMMSMVESMVAMQKVMFFFRQIYK
jgi:Ion transport protein